MKITFTKTQKPKQFSIKPRYHDPEKEEREERRRRYSAENTMPTGERMRKQMERRWNHTDRLKGKSRKMTWIYLIILFILIYMLFIN
ncbi:MAG: hypothetical protein JEZ03_12745 [Bacteroidales bacterium]|nr:hypothetical protein [Bacteroidales bacterium]